MPRGARVLGESGIYHVMLRGINQQQIFYDDEDYCRFITIISRMKEISHFELYAYCLMGNHVHLLIRETDEPLDRIFRRIGASFVYWYNMKYERSGHLFQDRFKSEPVENDVYFLSVLRYILQNPVKAGLCQRPEQYSYSSAKEYIGGLSGITDTKFAFSILEADDFSCFVLQDSADEHMDVLPRGSYRIVDYRAKIAIAEKLGENYMYTPKAADLPELFKLIRELTGMGVSIRQLCRLTGIPKALVEKALK